MKYVVPVDGEEREMLSGHALHEHFRRYLVVCWMITHKKYTNEFCIIDRIIRNSFIHSTYMISK